MNDVDLSPVNPRLPNPLLNARWVGERLLEKKGELPYGHFLPWVKDHFKGSTRTAHVYMRIAKSENWRLICNHNLSIKAALKVIQRYNRFSVVTC